MRVLMFVFVFLLGAMFVIFLDVNNGLILSILANVYINFLLSKLFCMNLGPVLVLAPLGYIMHYLFITIFYCKHRVK